MGWNVCTIATRQKRPFPAILPTCHYSNKQFQHPVAMPATIPFGEVSPRLSPAAGFSVATSTIGRLDRLNDLFRDLSHVIIDD